jgi:hypothetical protein
MRDSIVNGTMPRTDNEVEALGRVAVARRVVVSVASDFALHIAA